MEKKRFYVNIGSGEISQVKYGNNSTFTIEATHDEIVLLREKMDNMHDASYNSFWRAQVPAKPYHDDNANDHYDIGISEAYKMIYDLGNVEAKEHIEEMGIFGDQHL